MISIFCSQPSAAQWLAENGTSPASLRCRNSPLATWDLDSPDCLYTGGPNRFALARSLRADGAHFNPPVDLISPESIRHVARQLIWGSVDPFNSPRSFPVEAARLSVADVGNVRGYASAQSSVIQFHPRFSSRVTRFVPPRWVPGRYAIYHEGHGLFAAAAVADGAETISWLLERGWQVDAVDMPLMGRNVVEIDDEVPDHYGLDPFDDGERSPISLLLLPVKALIDRIEAERLPDQPGTVLLIGRSGGGWTTYTYAALDPRVDVAVNVAGGIPLSEAWTSPFGRPQAGDYEQYASHLYDVLGHEDLMAAAGTRASMHLYGQFDPCCYAITNSAEARFLEFLEEYGHSFGKRIDTFVDHEFDGHGLGPAGYAALDRFLSDVTVPPIASTSSAGASYAPP